MIILIQCADRIGLVASISAVLQQQQLNIISLNEHVEKVDNRFFMRLDVEPDAEPKLLYQQLKLVLPADAIVSINPLPQKRIVVLVTKEHHCLADILIRNFYGTLGAQVLAVIGNHPILEDICVRFDVPFFGIAYDPETEKEETEAKIAAQIDQQKPDFIVLAKFMRILSPSFIGRYPQQIINIHHSFLPAFVGANPYRQAFRRGVKVIGATAHFVTDDLDEGPIIAQQTITVNHSFTAEDMIKTGREIETAVLAKSLQLVFNDRVFIHQNKTIVFE